MFISILSATSLTTQIYPDYLRTESLIEPVGIDHQTPQFSWIVKPTSPDLKNLKQTAYRILVASTPDNLIENKADLWDSGKVKSNETYAITYQGKPLSSNFKAYWKIQLWDQNLTISTWSKPSKLHHWLSQKIRLESKMDHSPHPRKQSIRF